MDYPIELTGRNISDEIVEAVKRQRGREMDREWLMTYANELRQQFPGMSNAMLAQMLLSIEGIDVDNIQELLLEQEEGMEAEAGDGTRFPNVGPKPKSQKRKPGQASPYPTKSDLAILKSVPRSDQDQRMSA
jgi:hypothetical protein